MTTKRTLKPGFFVERGLTFPTCHVCGASFTKYIRRRNTALAAGLVEDVGFACEASYTRLVRALFDPASHVDGVLASYDTVPRQDWEQVTPCSNAERVALGELKPVTASPKFEPGRPA